MDFIVTIDHQMSDTAWYSDILLPESTYLERWDPAETQGGVVPIVVARKEVIKPVFDTKSMREIAIGLAKAFLEVPGFLMMLKILRKQKQYLKIILKNSVLQGKSRWQNNLQCFLVDLKCWKRKVFFNLTDSVKYETTATGRVYI